MTSATQLMWPLLGEPTRDDCARQLRGDELQAAAEGHDVDADRGEVEGGAG